MTPRDAVGPAESGAPRPRATPYLASQLTSRAKRRLIVLFGGRDRARTVLLLASVLALASADTATVGASATELRQSLHIGNGDIGLLVAVSSLVGAVASLPFGILADRVRRTWMLSFAVASWGVTMFLSALAHSFGGLLFWRLWLGIATAAAGPAVASLVGDSFAGAERGKIYSYILTGELIGAGVGFAITGDIAALSWRAAFVILALATAPLAVALFRLPEPVRGGRGALRAEEPTSENRVLDDRATRPEPAPSPDPQVTDAQQLAFRRGIVPDFELARRARKRNMGLGSAIRYVLAVRTNVILIVSSACAYYFLAGVQTFGVEFVRGHFHVNAAFANLLMLLIGAGAAVGVIASGPLSDALLRRGHLNARILVPALAASLTVVLFIPALLTHSLLTALPYVIFAAVALSAQNPPIDAARLDIMPAPLWGRAEGIRTFLRTLAQALAPLLFGIFSDYIGLQATFLIMLLPLSASAVLLFRAMRTYPRDVATAAAATIPD